LTRGKSTLELIRSLRRSTRDLEKALSVAGGNQDGALSKTEAPSGIRRHVRSVLIVAEDSFSRALLVERLRAGSLFVECASDGECGLEKASLDVPDVVIVDHSAKGWFRGDVTAAVAPGRAPRPMAVFTIEGSLVGRSTGRSFTVVQWRDSAREVFDVILGLTKQNGEAPRE
jgi:hypothetical protein